MQIGLVLVRNNCFNLLISKLLLIIKQVPNSIHFFPQLPEEKFGIG
jgi:hypothetical protein